MKRNTRRVLVTGGCGFIGSHFVRRLLAEPGVFEVLNVDKLTYAANQAAVAEFRSRPNYSLLQTDICDGTALVQAMFDFEPHRVIHLAAETHVDRSIDAPMPFVRSNVEGTYQLLEAATQYYKERRLHDPLEFQLIHVSTDEVFGEVLGTRRAEVDDVFAPRSPYAASKAAAEHAVLAWRSTFGLPSCIVRLSNIFGPGQFPEKLIPLAIIRALHGESVPIFGDGLQERDWLFIEDAIDGLQAVLERAETGEVYQLSTEVGHTNLQVVSSLLEMIAERHQRRELPTLMSQSLEPAEVRQLFQHVEDRPGHDRRYAMKSSDSWRVLGTRPAVTLEQGLGQTIDWLLAHSDWWETILRSRYDLARLGRADQSLHPSDAKASP